MLAWKSGRKTVMMIMTMIFISCFLPFIVFPLNNIYLFYENENSYFCNIVLILITMIVNLFVCVSLFLHDPWLRGLVEL